MKIRYEFLDGEIKEIEIELSDEVEKTILDMTREEENLERKIRYHELKLDTEIDHSKWNESEDKGFSEGRIERQRKLCKALDSLTDEEYELLEKIYGRRTHEVKDIAGEYGVNTPAVYKKIGRIRKKIKKLL